MKKALVFYTYLPTWRIDIFNFLAHSYKLEICLTRFSEEAYTFDYQGLKKQLSADVKELNFGFDFMGWAFRFGILKNLIKSKPDIVFTHEYTPTSIFLALLKTIRFFDFRLIITTSDNLSISENAGLLKRLFRHFVLRAADGMVVYSKNVKHYFSKYEHLCIEVCPNIQDEKRILSNVAEVNLCEGGLRERVNFEEDYILFVGRLEHEKGVDILLNHFSNLKNKHIKLVIVGKGKLQSTLMLQAKFLEISNRIIWIRELNSCSIYALYRRARLFILPSRFEPFGAVVNEALIWGCPVLVSDRAGASQFVVEGVNGSIVNVDDEMDFELKLNKWLHATNSKNNRGNLMPYSFEDFVKAFIKVGYEKN